VLGISYKDNELTGYVINAANNS